jgi:hypothetical protein
MTTMQLIGWEDIEMLRRYNIIDDARLTSGVERLKSYLDAQKQKRKRVVSIRA